jgi:acetyl-CoA C-acetyltransferase
MCANIDVDQGAAVLLCSHEAARAAGVADDRMVFLIAGAEAHDQWFVTERHTLTASPAIEECYKRVVEVTDHLLYDFDGYKYHDLYSCFPSAVQIGMRALDLTDDDVLTVTGGLGFAGGPANNYPSHGIARMVETLRSDPEAVGLTTALGWYLTKHAVAAWSCRPPESAEGWYGYDSEEVQPLVDRQPRRSPAGLVDTEATLEASSISFERDGTPSIGIVTALLDDGRRAMANVRDADTLRAMAQDVWEGRRVKLRNDGTTNTLAI